MEKRSILLAGIPIIGTLAVANLMFFWLAPDVDCKMLVYCFCFGAIIIQGTTSAVLGYKFGMQKSMPVLVSGTAFALGILVAGGVMLALSAPFQMALYFMIVFAVLYLICVGFLACIAADELWDRVENAVIDSPSISHPLRDWINTLRATFSRHREGETDAERHVRNNREIHPDPASQSSGGAVEPPPLPNRGTLN